MGQIPRSTERILVLSKMSFLDHRNRYYILHLMVLSLHFNFQYFSINKNTDIENELTVQIQCQNTCNAVTIAN